MTVGMVLLGMMTMMGAPCTPSSRQKLSLRKEQSRLGLKVTTQTASPISAAFESLQLSAL